jgi:tetratricopeptide (TPR) repeat protein
MNMRIKKEMLIGIVVIAVIALGAGGAYSYRKYTIQNNLARRIAAISAGGPPATIDGLRAAIKEYERQIEQHVKDAAQTGVYWKILATRLQDRGLHNEALKALQQAIFYNGEDATIFYLTGISAAIVAKSSLGFPGTGSDAYGQNSERDRYFAIAEAAYRRSIELNDRYARPHYGLGILYVFELDRPEEAIPHLIRFLDLNGNDVDVMFVLARAYYMTGLYSSAVDLYDRIISLTKDTTKRDEAARNKDAILGLSYE